MIENALENKTARESKAQTLAVLLGISALLHGTFFLREWLILGAVLSLVQTFLIFQNRDMRDMMITPTDFLLFILIIQSMIGLVNPVKTSEGWFDVIRWVTIWFVFRIAHQIVDKDDQETFRSWIIGLGVILALLGFLPVFFSYMPFANFSGRWTSMFGYSNAFAVFCGAVLLLRPGSFLVTLVLLIALFNTGSRGAMSLFVIVWVIQNVLIREKDTKSFANSFYGLHRVIVRLKLPKLHILKTIILVNLGNRVLKILAGAFVLLFGIFFTVKLNPQALDHLSDWGLTTSLGERFLYLVDGLRLAWLNKGIPSAGGWLAFPRVQEIPYWVSDPHSIIIRILIHQGFVGLLAVLGWGVWTLGQIIKKGVIDRVEFWALVYLGIHAFIDADFLFGALGFLFWALFGILSVEGKPLLTIKFVKLRILVCALLLFNALIMLSLSLFPEKVLPQQLGEDQNNYSLRRQLAEKELQVMGANGLYAMEEVLKWEKFDLRAYEWAQGMVFDKAEELRHERPEESLKLYRWVENIPKRIEVLRDIGALEKILWPKVNEFSPSELSNLLQEYARERQLTLYTPSS